MYNVGKEETNILELTILSNLENINAIMIEEENNQQNRIKKLYEIARTQYRVLKDNVNIKNRTI